MGRSRVRAPAVPALALGLLATGLALLGPPAVAEQERAGRVETGPGTADGADYLSFRLRKVIPEQPMVARVQVLL